MGIIKIGSPKDKKGVTVNPSSVFFNGNNVAMIMNGENIIWDSAKPLVPAMTSNTTPYGEAFASSSLDARYYPWKAFEANGNVVGERCCWESYQTSGDIYIGYKFVNPVNVTKVYVAHINTAGNQYLLNEFKLQASNDGDSWIDLGDFSIEPVQNAEAIYSVNNRNYYSQYRILRVSGGNVNNGYYEVEVGQIQFYGR